MTNTITNVTPEVAVSNAVTHRAGKPRAIPMINALMRSAIAVTATIGCEL